MIQIDMKTPSSCYDCSFVKNERTNDYGSFCECGILEDCETINLLKHNKHPNCPLIEQESMLDKIRAEIEEQYGDCAICEYFEDFDYEENDISEYRAVGNISDILQIIDKHLEGIDLGDYPDAIPNQFDNMTGSMNL